MPRTRRAVLGGVPGLLGAAGGGALLAGCASEPPAPEPPLAPLAYGYLTPLPLRVASLEISATDPPATPGDLGATLSPTPAEAVRIMARDRLSTAGATGHAVFTVTRASLARGPGGALNCVLGCRLEVAGAEGGGPGNEGFVEAEARAGASGAEAERPQAAARLLRRTMDGLNVEFEYQVRRNLRDVLVNVAPPGQGGAALPAPEPGEIAREDLPKE